MRETLWVEKHNKVRMTMPPKKDEEIKQEGSQGKAQQPIVVTATHGDVPPEANEFALPGEAGAAQVAIQTEAIEEESRIKAQKEAAARRAQAMPLAFKPVVVLFISRTDELKAKLENLATSPAYAEDKKLIKFFDPAQSDVPAKDFMIAASNPANYASYFKAKLPLSTQNNAVYVLPSGTLYAKNEKKAPQVIEAGDAALLFKNLGEKKDFYLIPASSSDANLVRVTGEISNKIYQLNSANVDASLSAPVEGKFYDAIGAKYLDKKFLAFAQWVDGKGGIDEVTKLESDGKSLLDKALINNLVFGEDGELTKKEFRAKKVVAADGKITYTGNDGALIQAFVDGVIARKTADLTAIQAEIKIEEAKLNALNPDAVYDLDTLTKMRNDGNLITGRLAKLLAEEKAVIKHLTGMGVKDSSPLSSAASEKVKEFDAGIGRKSKEFESAAIEEKKTEVRNLIAAISTAADINTPESLKTKKQDIETKIAEIEKLIKNANESEKRAEKATAPSPRTSSPSSAASPLTSSSSGQSKVSTSQKDSLVTELKTDLNLAVAKKEVALLVDVYVEAETELNKVDRKVLTTADITKAKSAMTTIGTKLRNTQEDLNDLLIATLAQEQKEKINGVAVSLNNAKAVVEAKDAIDVALKELATVTSALKPAPVIPAVEAALPPVEKVEPAKILENIPAVEQQAEVLIAQKTAEAAALATHLQEMKAEPEKLRDGIKSLQDAIEKVEKIEAKKTVIKTIDGVEKPVEEVVVASNPDLLDDKKKKEVDDAKDLLAAAEKVQKEAIQELIEKAARLRVEITTFVDSIDARIKEIDGIIDPVALKNKCDLIAADLGENSKIKTLISEIEKFQEMAGKFGATKNQLAQFDLNDPTRKLLIAIDDVEHALEKTVTKRTEETRLEQEKGGREETINRLMIDVDKLHGQIDISAAMVGSLIAQLPNTNLDDLKRGEEKIIAMITTGDNSIEKLIAEIAALKDTLAEQPDDISQPADATLVAELSDKLKTAVAAKTDEINERQETAGREQQEAERQKEIQKLIEQVETRHEDIDTEKEVIVGQIAKLEEITVLEDLLVAVEKIYDEQLGENSKIKRYIDRVDVLRKKAVDLNASEEQLANFMVKDVLQLLIQQLNAAPVQVAVVQANLLEEKIKEFFVPDGDLEKAQGLITNVDDIAAHAAAVSVSLNRNRSELSEEQIKSLTDQQVLLSAAGAKIAVALGQVQSEQEKRKKLTFKANLEAKIKIADDKKMELVSYSESVFKNISESKGDAVLVVEKPDSKVADDAIADAKTVIEKYKTEFKIDGGIQPEGKVLSAEKKLTAEKENAEKSSKLLTATNELIVLIKSAAEFKLAAPADTITSPAEKIAHYAAEIERSGKARIDLSKKRNEVTIALSPRALSQEMVDAIRNAFDHLTAENKKALLEVKTIVTTARQAVTSETKRIKALLKTPIASNVISQIRADLVVLMTSAVTADAINDEILKAKDTLESFLPTENQKNFVEQVTKFTVDCNMELQKKEINLNEAAAKALRAKEEAEAAGSPPASSDEALAHAVANQIDVTKELMATGFYSHTKDLLHNDGVQGLKHLEGESVVDGTTKTFYVGSLELPLLHVAKENEASLPFVDGETSRLFEDALTKQLQSSFQKAELSTTESGTFLFAMNKPTLGAAAKGATGHNTILEVTLSAEGVDGKRTVSIKNIDSMAAESSLKLDDMGAGVIVSAVNAAFKDQIPATTVGYELSAMGLQRNSECVSYALVGIEARMASPEQKLHFDAIKNNSCDIQLRAMEIVAREDNRRAESSLDRTDPLKVIDPAQLKIVTAEDVTKYASVLPGMKEGDVAYIPVLENLLNVKVANENVAGEVPPEATVKVTELNSVVNPLDNDRDAKQKLSVAAALAVCADSQLNPIVNAAGEKITLAIKQTEAGANDVSVSEDGKISKVNFIATGSVVSAEGALKTAEIALTSTSSEDNKQKIQAQSSNPELVGEKELYETIARETFQKREKREKALTAERKLATFDRFAIQLSDLDFFGAKKETIIRGQKANLSPKEEMIIELHFQAGYRRVEFEGGTYYRVPRITKESMASLGVSVSPILTQPHVKPDLSAVAAASNTGLFVDFNMNHGAGMPDAVLQAKTILDNVLELHGKGYGKVGITCSANDIEAAEIHKAGGSIAARAGSAFAGATNQGLVMHAVMNLLENDRRYQSLATVFEIIPITAKPATADVIATDLQYARQFLEAKTDGGPSVVLGWQNQHSKNDYAVGKANSGNSQIQEGLKALKSAFEHKPSASSTLS